MTEDASDAEFGLAPGEDDHPELVRWRENVGHPVALDLARPASSPIRGVDLLCWNLAIGRARLGELLGRLRQGEFGGAMGDSDRPLVILAQEAFRTDPSVPPRVAGRFHGGRIRRARRHDVVELAREQGLSLRYLPSMRNGADRSDRGSAILATTPLVRAHGFSLPYVRQQRVAVAAELAQLPRLGWVSAHLDTGGRPRPRTRGSLRFGAGRVAQASALARRILAADAPGSVVLGADLNTPLGVRDPAYDSLVRAGFTPATPAARWRHTFHGPLRLLLDHVLFHSPDARVRNVTVMRIDEHSGDRGARIFGSDHHPLLARVELADS